MAIRITGMYSGLDTESIINELASAQSYKKNKLVKAQTKLSWKQDAWKALNTKIYSFYTKLDDLRLQSSYLKKKTTVSNPSAIKVTGNNVDGSHKVSVEKLSQRAVLTSGSLNNGDTYYTGNVTLGQLGLKGSGSIRLSDNTGSYVDINVSENMKINDFVKAIGDNSALTASFDQENQRIYLSSWASGEAGNFYLSGNDSVGMEALKTLKLLSSKDIDKLTAEGGEYDTWSKYKDADGKHTAAYDALIKEETLNRLKALKAENDALEAYNKKCDEANQKNRDKFKEILENKDGKYDDYKNYVTYSDSMTAADIKAAGDELYDKIYGKAEEKKIQAKDDDGNLLFEADGTTPIFEKNEDGTYKTETVRTGGMTQELDGLKKTLSEKQDALKQARKDLEANPEDASLKQAVKDAEDAVTAASKDVSDKQNAIDKAKEVYSVYSAYNKNESERSANQKQIDANSEYFSYDEGTKTFKEKVKDDSDSENITFTEVEVGLGDMAKKVTAQFDEKVEVAKQMMKADEQAKWKKAATGTKVDGEDAKIEVDGVTYTSSTDTLTVNGMTITALEETDKAVTVSTQNDTDGVYDMIKDFIKSYSELINEMDALYNAESAKDYEPLLAEEKEALTDTEVEEWEKKIKDSLLRRDSTLSDVASAMKTTMMQGISIGGVNFYLSDFGINTLGYFNSKDNERNAYHIDGDADDTSTKNNADKLREAINKNPDAVMQFFTGLTNNLHDTLAKKMSATSMSSALTFYNDKKMKEDYDDYTDKIKTQEEKLNAYIDKWYAKFSAMETALAKLESKNSSLSSLFGG